MPEIFNSVPDCSGKSISVPVYYCTVMGAEIVKQASMHSTKHKIIEPDCNKKKIIDRLILHWGITVNKYRTSFIGHGNRVPSFCL